MDRFIIEKPSLLSLIENTISRNKDMRLYHYRYFFNRMENQPIRLSYSSATSVELIIEVETRFGIDILKAVDKASNEIKNNLDKMAKIAVKSIKLTVKGVYDDKEKEVGVSN